jgi:hypothetical protein
MNSFIQTFFYLYQNTDFSNQFLVEKRNERETKISISIGVRELIIIQRTLVTECAFPFVS